MNQPRTSRRCSRPLRYKTRPGGNRDYNTIGLLALASQEAHEELPGDGAKNPGAQARQEVAASSDHVPASHLMQPIAPAVL